MREIPIARRGLHGERLGIVINGTLQYTGGLDEIALRE
ncbi:hypothetical protein OF001_U330006 [Pseudomonas sp. OF001]|nr:hypothetical protein OF001_U330006 [Pseudomonas sp. OF001]